jgi:hypothetical protein
MTNEVRRRLGLGFSIAMRDVLLDHVDGSCPYVPDDAVRRLSIVALLKREFLRFTPPGSPGPIPFRPTHTYITSRGREALAFLLADYADALTRAGILRDDAFAEVAEKPHAFAGIIPGLIVLDKL